MVDRARLKEVFARVADAPENDRAALLDELCVGDGELRKQAQALLDAEASAPTFLDRPLVGQGLGAMVDQILAEAPREERDAEPIGTIGRYAIVRKIAEGGMGAIYEALQDEPHRRIALKLIRGTAATLELKQRFRREAEVLGRLQHPSIARIYEAGSAAVAFSDGSTATLPFLAMELIEGLSLLRHAEKHALTTRARLQLLAEIAEAVQHAHQQGVIHRDLKPANILVTADGCPKVLDFGVARLVDPEAEASFVATQAGRIVGTLAYMSPEQVQGGTIDTRSDIYALGVIAFELLSGESPLAIDSSSIASAARTIVEVAPRTLGTVARSLRGDVSTIVGKALEKDPARRYASAAELATDLRRFLANRPIHARPPSALYAAAKFAARNKLFVGALAVILFVLVTATIVSTGLALAADREATRARAVAQFLRSMLDGIKPAVARSMDTALLEHILRATVERLDAGELRKQPEVEAELRVVVASTYERIARHAEAIAMYERAVALYEEAFGRYSFKPLETRHALVGALLEQGDRARAEQVLLALREDFEAHPTGDDARFLECQILQALAALLSEQHRHEEALEPMRRAYEGWSRMFGADSGLAISAQNGLGGIYSETGRHDLAIQTYERVLQLVSSKRGADHPSVAILENNLATAWIAAGRAEAGRPRIEHAIAIQRAVLPANHPSLAMSLRTLSRIVRESDPPLAESALREALQCYRASLTPAHETTREALIELSDWLASRGELGAAIELELQSHADLVAAQAEEARLRAAALRIAELYERWNAREPAPIRKAQAEEWRRRAGP